MKIWLYPLKPWVWLLQFMMTSSNGNIFRVTCHLCGEFAGPRLNSQHTGQWRGTLIFSLICPNKRLSKQWWGLWFETPSSSLWRHCNVKLWHGGVITSGRLTARSREVSKPRDSSLDFFNCSEIWQAPRQQRCRDACQISERNDHYNTQSRGFETSRDLSVRRLIA